MSKPLRDLLRITDEKAEALCNTWGDNVYANVQDFAPAASGAILRALEPVHRAQRCNIGWEYKIGSMDLIGVSPFDAPPPHTISKFLEWWRSEAGPGGRRAKEMADRKVVRHEDRKLKRRSRLKRKITKELPELKAELVSKKMQSKLYADLLDTAYEKRRRLSERSDAIEAHMARTEQWTREMTPKIQKEESTLDKIMAAREAAIESGTVPVDIDFDEFKKSFELAEQKRGRGRPKKVKPPRTFDKQPEDFKSYRRRQEALPKIEAEIEAIDKRIEGLYTSWDKAEAERKKFESSKKARSIRLRVARYENWYDLYLEYLRRRKG